MNRRYCPRCLGFGTITAYRSQPQPTGQTLIIEVSETCPACRGTGTKQPPTGS